MLFSGCLIAQPADTSTEAPPVHSITGTISNEGGVYVIVSGTESTEIDSRQLDLAPYVGKSVTVMGEYSGTTLFVDTVK